MDEYYQTLGVTKSATLDEIKVAYRKLAKKYHPDKEGGDTATFQKIQAAYAVLSDPDKRAAYDAPTHQGGFHQGGFPRGFEHIFSHFGGQRGFEELFGERYRPRNQTLNIQTSITLEEAHSGKDLIANIKLPSGKEQIINVKIPPGIINGAVLKLNEIGDNQVQNMPRGDIHLMVLVTNHNEFERQGDDLIKEIEVSALDAILGTDMMIRTIDGKLLNVTINPGTQPGTMLGIQGHGMPNMNDNRFKGRLLLKIKVTIPTLLTEHQKNLIRQAKN
jgi:DnaJ-class molecular chaperone